MFTRAVEESVIPNAAENGVGFIAFSPLAQGLLTNKYLHGIPEGSRAARADGFLKAEQVTAEVINKVTQLNNLATERGQTLAEMALAWTMRDPAVSSVIIGASSVKQLNDNLKCLDNLNFDSLELNRIDEILSNK
jgi:L-glyceraldehyde 3-phosphate reductase